MEQDEPLEERIKEQFEECENDENWYRCRTCGEKHYFGENRKSDLLEHLDSHE